MKSKLLIACVITCLICCVPVFSNNSDFNGHFMMDVDSQKYEDVSVCEPNGALGCVEEYWAEGTCCELDGDEVVIYYYDNSLLVDGETSAYEHAYNDLTNSYLYEEYKKDGNFIILVNNLGMKNVPHYLIGTADDDEAVFVGGNDLNKITRYAHSIQFIGD